MPFVIHASFSVAGEISDPHHWCATVFASSRALPRSGFIATISGAHAAEIESLGNSTTSSRPDSAPPNLSVINSNDLATFSARSCPFSRFPSVRKTLIFGIPGAVIAGRNLPATIVPGKPDLSHLKSNCFRPPAISCSSFLLPPPLPTTVSSFGTVMCISAVKRSVNNPGMEIGNHRPA
jgi:hypothetical protein